MSVTYKERQAKLGNIVLKILPKVMQTILKECISPRALHVKYQLKDIRTSLTEKEISVMEKLPNIDEFTIELCYKILRYENLILEPSCKWGLSPNDTDVEIADDIQRILFATNEVICKQFDDVSDNYYEGFQKRVQKILKRVDKFLHQDFSAKLYKTIFQSDINSTDILQDLALLKQIDVTQIVDDESENRERISRMSLAIIDTFPNIFRDIIRSTISPSELYQKCISHLCSFSADQTNCLRELQSSNSYDSFDISLIYKLLRQFELVSPPTKGWGNVPDKEDIQLSDDIERIRRYRNQLAHRSSSTMTKEEFDNYFDQFCGIGKRIDRNFFQKTNYEYQIIGHQTCRMDIQMQIKYNNSLKELENLRLKFENLPIKFFWGNSFDRCLLNLRSMLKSEKSEGRRKVRVQIIFQKESDIGNTIDILNSLKREINEDLSGIEFIVATQGSIVLNVEIFLEMMETNEILQSTLSLFIGKIWKIIQTSSFESIDMVILPVEEYSQWNVTTTTAEPVRLDFDIEADLFETDDHMEEQLRKISKAFSKPSNGSGTSSNITATLLPFYFETTDFVKAQTPVVHSLPVSLTLRQKLNIKSSMNVKPSSLDCIKIDEKLVFADCDNKQLTICNYDGTKIHHIRLPYYPWQITQIDINTVAVSCTDDKTILITNISNCSVDSEIKTNESCWGISYNDNKLYVNIGKRIMDVMDLNGQVIRSVPLPSEEVSDITVEKDRFVCSDLKSVFCCSLDGKVLWEFKNEKYKKLRRVTTDDEGNVYVTDTKTNTVIVISNNGQDYRQILSESDELIEPYGIHFINKKNTLMVCNDLGGMIFLFDVKRNINKPK